MAAEAKALLDELMGRSRNLDPSQQPADLKWNDDDVCKYFLCGFCPHELFTNTRADLGACSKIHDEALRKDYQGSSRFEKCGYEEDFMRFLNMLINDVEKRIRRGHQRLELNSQQASMNGTNNVNDEKITMLTERINELVVQAEELGCEGKVEEAQGVMKLVDQLKEERHQLETKPAMQDDGGPLMKQMEVCDVCGAFLIVGDAPQRQDEHLMGKQHAGYAQVRAEIDRRKKRVRDETEAREANETRLRLEREEREKERQREREERRQRERDVDKRRDRDRDVRRRRSRSRSRDRGKDRRRSRSRERRRQRSLSRDRKNRRSRSRNRDSRGKRSRRSASKDRKRDHRRSRERKSRSRSRDRKDRSRDKDYERNGESRSSRDKTGSRGDSWAEDRSSKGRDNDQYKDELPGSEDGEIRPATYSGDSNDVAKEMSSSYDGGEEKEEGELCGDNQTTSEGDSKMDE